MKKNILILIGCIFSFALIIGISFAAWGVHNGTGDSDSASTQASKSYNTNDLIYYNTSKVDGEGIECFSYYKTGFLNNDGSLSNTGVLTAYYVIDFDKAKANYSEFDNLNIYFTLKRGADSTQINFNSFMGNVSAACYQDDSTTNILSGTTAMLSMSMDDINELSGLNEIAINFTFTHATGSTFESEVYNYLRNLTFVVETRVEGTNN